MKDGFEALPDPAIEKSDSPKKDPL